MKKYFLTKEEKRNFIKRYYCYHTPAGHFIDITTMERNKIGTNPYDEDSKKALDRKMHKQTSDMILEYDILSKFSHCCEQVLGIIILTSALICSLCGAKSIFLPISIAGAILLSIKPTYLTCKARLELNQIKKLKIYMENEDQFEKISKDKLIENEKIRNKIKDDNINLSNIDQIPLTMLKKIKTYLNLYANTIENDKEKEVDNGISKIKKG